MQLNGLIFLNSLFHSDDALVSRSSLSIILTYGIDIAILLFPRKFKVCSHPPAVIHSFFNPFKSGNVPDASYFVFYCVGHIPLVGLSNNKKNIIE